MLALTSIAMHGSVSVRSRSKPELGSIAAGVRAESPKGRPTVDVCICTYYRAAILDALRAVAAQSIRDEVAMRVIVADNAPHAEAQSRVTAAARDLNLDVLYVHAPAKNISIARNACLERARAGVRFRACWW